MQEQWCWSGYCCSQWAGGSSFLLEPTCVCTGCIAVADVSVSVLGWSSGSGQVGFCRCHPFPPISSSHRAHIWSPEATSSTGGSYFSGAINMFMTCLQQPAQAQGHGAITRVIQDWALNWLAQPCFWLTNIRRQNRKISFGIYSLLSLSPSSKKAVTCLKAKAGFPHKSQNLEKHKALFLSPSCWGSLNKGLWTQPVASYAAFQLQWIEGQISLYAKQFPGLWFTKLEYDGLYNLTYSQLIVYSACKKYTPEQKFYLLIYWQSGKINSEKCWG